MGRSVIPRQADTPQRGQPVPRLRWRIISAFVTVVCLCAAVIINACSGGSTPSFYIGRLDPIAGQWTAYGTGTGFAAQLSNPFAIPTQASGKTINYVYTVQPLAIGKTMTLNYSITGPAAFAPLPESACGAGGCGGALLRLFIWGNISDTTSNRWWCPTPANLVTGNQILSCVINQTWTGTGLPGQSQQGFASSVANPFAAGFTFGGMFAGHGVWATSGTATFKVNSFTVQ